MQFFKLLVAQQMTGEGQARSNADNAKLRAQGHGQHGSGRFERCFGQRVAKKVRVLVPQFLVQQVHHHAERPARLGSGRTVAAGHMRVKCLRQDDGGAGVAAQVLVHGVEGKAGGRIVFKRGGAVDDGVNPAKLLDHFRQQVAYRRRVRQVGAKGGARTGQLGAVGNGFGGVFP